MSRPAKPVTKINRLVGTPPLFEVGILVKSAAIAAQIRQALGIDPAVIRDGVTGDLVRVVVNDGILGLDAAPDGSVEGACPLTDPVTGKNYWPVSTGGVIGIEEIL